MGFENDNSHNTRNCNKPFSPTRDSKMKSLFPNDRLGPFACRIRIEAVFISTGDRGRAFHL